MDRQRRDSQRELQSGDLSDEARLVAERLEQLSVDDAERVLERAISLQLQQRDTSMPERMMDRRALQRIAAELDIEPQHLEQALLEELYRLDVDDPTLLDRLTVPASLKARGIAPLPASAARQVVDLWMERHEGMRKTAERTRGAEWRKNTSLAVSARRALRMSDSSGHLRRVPVSTRVRPATEDQAVVVVEAETSRLRKLAVAVATGAAVTAAGGLAVAAGSAVGEGGLVAEGVATAGVAAMVGTGILLGVKMWVNQIREAVRGAVTAVTNPQLIRDRSIPGLIGELLGDWTGFTAELRNEMRPKRGPR